MAKTPYDTDLDRNPANYQPLTPLGFLERAAAVFPDHTAIINGPLRRSYAEFYARTRRLASALAKRGIKRGDSVSAMLANTPAMLECHYGVPMTQGVLNTLNTRLDAPIIAFSLDHAEAKVVIIDRELPGLIGVLTNALIGTDSSIIQVHGWGHHGGQGHHYGWGRGHHYGWGHRHRW